MFLFFLLVSVPPIHRLFMQIIISVVVSQSHRHYFTTLTAVATQSSGRWPRSCSFARSLVSELFLFFTTDFARFSKSQLNSQHNEPINSPRRLPPAQQLIAVVVHLRDPPQPTHLTAAAVAACRHRYLHRLPQPPRLVVPTSSAAGGQAKDVILFVAKVVLAGTL